MERTVIFEHERGVLYCLGKFQRVLEPGVNWHLRFRTRVYKLDLRPRSVTVPGQEVLSSDNVGLKVSLTAQYQIADGHAAINNSESYEATVYLELQVALREIVGEVKIDDLLARRQEIGRQVYERTEEKVRALGLRLLSVGVKDIMFPGELKKIFAEVVRAQKEGLAALEKARGETAALRNLANAAKMIEGNPALLQLRLLQVLGDGTGNTVVWGLPPEANSLPLRPRGTTPPENTPG